MKLNKQIVANIISTIASCVILIILAFIHPKFLEAATRMEFPEYDIYRSIIAIGMIIIGVLIELKRLISGFEKGFCINKISLILSLLLMIIVFLPFTIGIEITGIGIYNTILQVGIFRSVLSMIVGIGLVRSITKINN